MKRVDTSVYSTIQQVLAGKFAGGTNAVFSLKNDGVGLGKISPKVPAADVKKVQAGREADRERQDLEHPDHRRVVLALGPVRVGGPQVHRPAVHARARPVLVGLFG